MLAALALPRLLVCLPDRILMILGACLVTVCMAAGPLALAWLGSWLALLMLAGLGHSLVTTPVGRIIRRSATPGKRPALFAAQFALSHACWLVTYPLAGWLGAAVGLSTVFALMAGIAAAAAGLGAWPWHGHEDAAAVTAVDIE